MFSSTPLDCTICNTAEGNCGFMKNKTDFMPIHNKSFNPNYNTAWVKKYCTMTAVDEFTLYFPYVLITIALTMVLIEKGFVKYAYPVIYTRILLYIESFQNYYY